MSDPPVLRRTSPSVQHLTNTLTSILPRLLLFSLVFFGLPLPNRYYTCTAENVELKDYKFGSQFRIEITHNKRRSLNAQIVPPAEQYVNKSSPIALVGQTHKLHCFFSGYPEPTPTWKRNGVVISEDNDEGFSFESYGKTLVFNVTLDKAGMYECTFPKYNDLDRNFTVVVEAAPYWPDGPPANTNTSEGETVTFDCRTSGKPEPVVTFYKNGVEMSKKPKTGEKYVIDGSKLTIYDVRKGIGGHGDNAVYQCKAENKHGYLWTNFYLNLLAFQPKLLEEPGEVEAVEGKPFTLACKFFASPLANVRWDSPLLLGNPQRSNVDQFGVGRLTIEKVEASHEGEYTCIGENKYGTARGVVKLLVRKPTKLAPFPESNQISQAGRPLLLPCNADHDENLDITYAWKVNGLPLDQEKLDSGQYEINDDNTLVIATPTQYDSAEYTCVASTKLDTVEKTIRINIQDVPNPVHAAYIQKCDSQGHSVQITFEHLESVNTAVPVKEFWIRYITDPDVDSDRWKIHPVPISAIDHETVQDEERRVQAPVTISLKPFGRYVFQVIARNSVGDSAPQKVKGTCETSAKAPSTNPTNVRVEGSQPDNLIVYWDPMPREEWNGPEFGYEVQYRPKHSQEWTTVTVSDPFESKLTIDFDDQQPWKPYEVQVRAKNSLGKSLVAPATVEGRTGEGDPGVTPTGFRVTNIGSTSADFHWDPVEPSAVQGNFTGYKITFWYDDEDGAFDEEAASTGENVARYRRGTHRVLRDLGSTPASNRKHVIVSPTASMVTIHGLKPNAINYATIAVLNGQNEGTPAEPISFRTREGVPTPVRELHAYPMNNRSPGERGVVVLKWDRPRSPNGRLTHYSVVKCHTQGRDRQHCEAPTDIASDVDEIRLQGLDFESDYRFKVYAHTSAGQGPPNSADARTLPEALRLNLEPARPTLEEQGISDDHFNVSFVPGDFNPDEQRPVGNAYFVKYREEGDSEWQKKHATGDSLEVQVDGLTPGTKYEVAVVSVQTDADGTSRETESRTHHITTTGVSPKHARFFWILGVLLIILMLLVILCIICYITRQRGQKYPVSEKERLQGREPILPKDRGFDDYCKTEDEEKKSLTGHSRAGESETDSMAEYGDGDPGRFTEDGSFIGQYGLNKTLVTSSDRP
ncbi:fibronectin type III domain protein [Aphelenchoides avenae]|nr:fibronectin type III domain protein [Aphelenchus avenae]